MAKSQHSSQLSWEEIWGFRGSQPQREPLTRQEQVTEKGK